MGRTVSLIVRCLNEEAHIGRLLSGVERQTQPVDEVIVVDSGSTDATLAIASRFGAEIIEIDPSEFSFGRALNRGLEAATGDVAIIASAHVYPVYDSWVERITNPLDVSTGVAIAYGRQVTPPGGRLSESRLMQQWFPADSIAFQGNPFHNNANSAIRRDVWADLRYDEDLTGLEDLDFGKRVMDAGGSISYVAEAPVVHVHDEVFGQIRNRYRREAIAHRRIFSEQRMSSLSAVRLAGANIAGDLRTAAGEGRLLREARGVIGFRTAQFLGTWEGFAHEGPMTRELRRRFYYPNSSVTGATNTPTAAPGTPIEYDESPEPKVGDNR